MMTKAAQDDRAKPEDAPVIVQSQLRDEITGQDADELYSSV
jgi:hypothetical protein